jgi:hypothetical protein
MVRDLNYGRLKQLEEESTYQIKQLEEENGNLSIQLRKTHIKAEKVSRGWFLCVRFMCSFSAQLCNVEVLSYGGVEGINNSMKNAILSLYWIARGLKSRGAKLETKLKKVRKSYIKMMTAQRVFSKSYGLLYL